MLDPITNPTPPVRPADPVATLKLPDAKSASEVAKDAAPELLPDPVVKTWSPLLPSVEAPVLRLMLPLAVWELPAEIDTAPPAPVDSAEPAEISTAPPMPSEPAASMKIDPADPLLAAAPLLISTDPPTPPLELVVDPSSRRPPAAEVAAD